MVVFINGMPDKSQYRKFILNNVKGQDDYANMTEVLTRRFSDHLSYTHKCMHKCSGNEIEEHYEHNDKINAPEMHQNDKYPPENNRDKTYCYVNCLHETQYYGEHIFKKNLPDRNRPASGKDKPGIEFPDLLLVDGGKGQISMAMAVLKNLGIENRFQVAGIAKKVTDKGEEQDKIYLPNRSNPVNFTNAQKALFLLQRLRDEAHRFAITFQRKRRSKRAELSILDGIPGIGPKRKQMLLEKYKGISKLKQASVKELASLPGMTLSAAQNIIKKFDRI